MNHARKIQNLQVQTNNKTACINHGRRNKIMRTIVKETQKEKNKKRVEIKSEIALTHTRWENKHRLPLTFSPSAFSSNRIFFCLQSNFQSIKQSNQISKSTQLALPDQNARNKTKHTYTCTNRDTWHTSTMNHKCLVTQKTRRSRQNRIDRRNTDLPTQNVNPRKKQVHDQTCSEKK